MCWLHSRATRRRPSKRLIRITWSAVGLLSVFHAVFVFDATIPYANYGAYSNEAGILTALYTGTTPLDFGYFFMPIIMTGHLNI